MNATTQWVAHDTYKKTIPVRHSLIAAIKILFKGELDITWEVPANRKDKRLRISGVKQNNGSIKLTPVRRSI